MNDSTLDLEALRFPIGRFEVPAARLSNNDRQTMIARIAATPGGLRDAVRGLDEDQLDTR